MEKKTLSHYKKILILGSGALKIGEAGEFDYSGSQGAKALKEEGINTVLINPNIATIQTSTDFVSQVYFLPVTPYFTEKIIQKEKPDGILLGFGGQTALNCGLALAEDGILKKYHVDVLGTPISSIVKTEDRLLFRKTIEKLGLKVPKSKLCKDIPGVKRLGDDITYPVIVRAGYSLGGLGSGMAKNKAQLLILAQKALTLAPQILIEEYLLNWKELEYEVVRDAYDNAIVVCNMENMDPMGIHTGESIVVAPSQTLNNSEYHKLREIAIKVIRSLPIIGECNIQFALNPKNDEYRIIEVNARLSRSSALASKATGYPLAYVAAKLALGYQLPDIKNKITQKTTAFFEPSLDYVVVKIPRWDFLKFNTPGQLLGSEMQSVGEVMAIGRSFEEALQKAIRSLCIDYEGIISGELDKDKINQSKNTKIEYKSLLPTTDRPYNIAFNIFYGQTLDEINRETGIDIWFLERIKTIVDFYKILLKQKYPLSQEIVLEAKKLGFSDVQLARIVAVPSASIRNLRKKLGLTPKICSIDTLAGEFPAQTNYLFFSYHREKHDIPPGNPHQIAIIGGGPYQIGSSVEFDWCAVSTVLTAKKLGYSPIMINCNPETVSTDYDISDKLYFEELSLERILDIADFENCPFIVSVGGQIPNTLSSKLQKEGIRLLGTSPKAIDQAEDRNKFSAFLDKLHISQPYWRKIKVTKDALAFAKRIGYPVLVRPSYVLSGRAMFTAYSQEALSVYLQHAQSLISSEYPMVISKFLRGTKEVDFDGVAQNGKIIVSAISEHVEHAGVHSGDATLALPTFSLNPSSLAKIEQISQQIAKRLPIHGPFNIQYLVNDQNENNPQIFVIEANLRASRSFPFVSKVLDSNFIDLATRVMLGSKVSRSHSHTPNYFGIKAPHFSFTRLREVDPVLRVEMASTGEVACFGNTIYEAYLKAQLSTGITLPQKRALLSLGGEEGKSRLLPAARLLHEMGFSLYATKNTADYLKMAGIPSHFVYKVQEQKHPNVVDLIREKKVELVINLSDRGDLGTKRITKQATDGYLIRRAAVDTNIPLFTKATIANLFVKSLYKYKMDTLLIKSWSDYVTNHSKKE